MLNMCIYSRINEFEVQSLSAELVQKKGESAMDLVHFAIVENKGVKYESAG